VIIQGGKRPYEFLSARRRRGELSDFVGKRYPIIFTTRKPQLKGGTVLGQKDSSDAHFTPKIADFATLPLATIFIRIHKNFAVY